uniref:PDEase domain-containing protein n=1 Tax=Heterosigma akashiwo TaxID=2829 RepID=A0A7S3YAY4_HETAK
MIINIDGVGTYEFDTGYTRDKNMKKVYGDDGTSYVALSQTYSAKVQAAYNIAEITIVILLLVWFSISFTQAMDKVIVAPMERIMARLRVSAHSLMANVKALDHVENVDVDELEASLETDLLEQVLEKLVALVRMASPHAEEHVFRDVGLEQENTVMQTYVASQFTTAGVVARERRKKDRAHSEKTLAAAAAATWLRALSHRSSEDQGLTDQGFRAMLETWDFDALSATDALLLDVLHHLFAAAGAGAALQVTQNAFDPVFAALKSKYLPNPYQNWRHGVDVCFATFQLARAARSRAFVSPAEQACLLLAALAHDAGHPGLNNAFLVNTQNKLAVTYNDVSPLENMHSSVLFEILKEPETNVLVKLDKETFTSVRKLMVQAILGTDMKSHFAQINQINALQEKHGGEFLAFHAGEVPAPECLRETSEHKLFLVEMLLHSADISGPVKPPAISKAWADLVIQEFFAQGEEEKSLGMPASPMMDKDTTNIPNMQMGFIEFVVSPLYFGMARLFPDMAGCLDAMLENHEVYRALKEEEIRAQGGDAAEAEVEKLREKAAGLAAKVRNLQELRSKTGKSNQNQVGKEDEGKKEEQLDRMEAGAGGQ